MRLPVSRVADVPECRCYGFPSYRTLLRFHSCDNEAKLENFLDAKAGRHSDPDLNPKPARVRV